MSVITKQKRASIYKEENFCSHANWILRPFLSCNLGIVRCTVKHRLMIEPLKKSYPFVDLLIEAVITFGVQAHTSKSDCLRTQSVITLLK